MEKSEQSESSDQSDHELRLSYYSESFSGMLILAVTRILIVTVLLSHTYTSQK